MVRLEGYPAVDSKGPRDELKCAQTGLSTHDYKKDVAIVLPGICVSANVHLYIYSVVCLYQSCYNLLLGQNYTNLLHTLVKGNVSLDPITASIQELAFAAKEAEEEAMVR